MSAGTPSNEDQFPSIIFKVKGALYSINSQYVDTILQLPKYECIPDSPAVITGIFTYHGQTVMMYDLRTALHMQPLESEFQDFTQMIDSRKQDHINWVEELSRCVHEGERFTLATDPHKCAFGKWYYNFRSDNNALNFHLRKIEDPHAKLHEAALEVEHCSQDCENCKRDECLKKVLDRVRNESMPKILELLDETKEVFSDAMYHEMVLVLNGEEHLGLVVDEVLSVEDIAPADDGSALSALPASPLVAQVVKSKNIEGLILDLNVDGLLTSAC